MNSKTVFGTKFYSSFADCVCHYGKKLSYECGFESNNQFYCRIFWEDLDFDTQCNLQARLLKIFQEALGDDANMSKMQVKPNSVVFYAKCTFPAIIQNKTIERF